MFYTRDIARGQWRDILPALGIPSDWLTKPGKPCLICGGHDRSSFDDLEGRGTYICRHCGAGDGFTLLMKVHGWDFKRTAEAVRKVLGAEGRGPLPNPPPKPPPARPPSTADYARKIWGRASANDAEVKTHPYAMRKRIGHAAGAARGRVTGKLVGEDADCLIVPSRAADGAVVGVECIDSEGKKQSFGQKAELILGNDLDPELPFVVFEGWASGVKWLDHRKWNACAAVSFGKGRQDTLADQLRGRYPAHTIIIAREVDHA